MDTSTQSIFFTLPHEILVELLLWTPTVSIINFYSVNSTHLKLFDDQHGIWEQLSRKIFHWSALDTPVQGRHLSILKNTIQLSINWKKEFRIASYIKERLHNAKFVASYRSNNVEVNNDRIKGLSLNIEYNQPGELCFASVVQSDTVLYPHPIGNFSTAYFEVELLHKPTPKEKSEASAIGGALEGYMAYVGAARSSYGITTAAEVFLECDFTLVHNIVPVLEEGDIMGFGINFATNSVFFTKNGNLIYETNQNNDKRPLTNLKSQRATISLFQDELLVNMGSHPFSFDLLKYQQSKDKPKESFKLFSEIIIPHLIAFPDDEYMKKSPVTVGYYVSDRNLPQPPFSLPPFLYLLTYGAKHPESKVHIEPEDLSDFEYFRMLLNSFETYKQLTPGVDSEQAELLLNAADPFMEQHHPDYKSKTWLERIAIAEGVIEALFHERCMYFVKLHIDELLFELSYSNSNWAMMLLAEHELYFTARPDVNGEHWTREVMRRILDRENNCPTLDDLYTECMINMLRIRFSGMGDIMNQRCIRHLPAKIKESNIMKKISCEDSIIANNYKTIISGLQRKVKDSVPIKKNNKPNPFELILVQHEMNQILIALAKPELKELPEVKQQFDGWILYGIFKLKLSPDNFSSQKAYFEKLALQNRELITDELQIAYFEEFLKAVPQAPAKVFTMGPLRMVFGFQFDKNAPIEKLRLQAKQQIEQRIKKYRNGGTAKDTSVRSTFGQTKTLILSAAVILGLASVVGGYFFTKRKTNK